MKKLSKLLIIVTTLISLSGVFGSFPAYAEESSETTTGGGGTSSASTPKEEKKEASSSGLGVCRYFLGMTSWDCGIKEDWSGSSIEDNQISRNIWIIVGNISNDIVVIAAYLILGYVIYGGYLYMSAAGDPGKAASGRKTLTQAFIGLGIVMSAKVIINTIHLVLIGDGAFSAQNCAETKCVNPTDMIANIIQWVIGIAGVVSVIFIIIGAVGYMTSAGDSSKLQKAKNTILYALIGLAIVGLAEVITAFVTNTIKNANSTGCITTNNVIAKELTHENQIR